MIDIKIRSSVVCIVILVGLLWLLTLTSTSYTQEQVETPQVVQDVEWHPRGEGLLVTGRGRQGVWGLWLYDTNLQLVRFFQFENPVSADWSPDGTRFSMGRNIVNAQTLETLVTLDSNSGIGGWSPDASRVLAWADETHLGLFNAQNGQLERRIAVGSTIPDYVSWSPDGRLFAFVRPTGETDIVDAQDGRRLSTIAMVYPLGLRWSPDSRLLVASFLEIVAPDTPGVIPGAPSPTLALLRVWDAQTGDLLDEYSGMPSVPQVLRWGKNQNELIGTDPVGLLYVWNLETDTSIVMSTSGSPGPIDYSPYNGRLIVGGNILGKEPTSLIGRTLFAEQTWSQVIVPNVLEVIVPIASLQRLADIQALCAAEAPQTYAATVATLEVPATAADLTDFVAQVESLPEGAIPAACRADLLAVADALR